MIQHSTAATVSIRRRPHLCHLYGIAIGPQPLRIPLDALLRSGPQTRRPSCRAEGGGRPSGAHPAVPERDRRTPGVAPRERDGGGRDDDEQELKGEEPGDGEEVERAEEFDSDERECSVVDGDSWTGECTRVQDPMLY